MKSFNDMASELSKRVESLPDSRDKEILAHEVNYLISNKDSFPPERDIRHRLGRLEGRANKMASGKRGIALLEGILALLIGTGVTFHFMDKKEDIRERKASSKKIMAEAKTDKIKAKTDKIEVKGQKKVNIIREKQKVKIKKLDYKSLKLKYKLKKLETSNPLGEKPLHPSEITSVEIEETETVAIPSPKEAKKLKKCKRKPKFYKRNQQLCDKLRHKFY